MSRGTWADIRRSNNFYIDTYRRGIIVLLVSVVLNGLLGLAICNVYLGLPEPDFYATDGVTHPIRLTAMNTPNYTSNALLTDEQNNYDTTRAVPQ